jgi:ABC-type amino acid transport substrate-binding protein
VLFAGWFADAVVRASDYPRLALTGLVTFFGSLNVAVPFLLDLFRIPVDTFQLFLASGVVNSRFGTLVAAMHTVTVALLGACAMTGSLRWQRRPLIKYVAVTAVLTVAVIGGARALFASVLDQRYTKDQVLSAMHLSRQAEPADIHRTAISMPADADGAGRLEAIRSRGRLRVGFLPDALPFAFFNQRQELVGFDIELAHRLANELGVRLDLVAVEREHLDEELARGYCDIVMSGVAVTTDRASRTTLSSPYLDETLAFVVPDASRARFETWDGIRSLGAITIDVPNVPYYIEQLRLRLPGATLRPMTGIAATLELTPRIEAMALPAERGSAWTLLYPAYSVVVPEPGLVKVPLAFPIARRDQAFATFINTWIDLKRKDGTFDALYQYWILGHDPAGRPERWSIIRNVLHWVE